MSLLSQQFYYNTNAGPHYEDISRLPNTAPTHYPVKLIAYYLPQFHPIEHNNRAWSLGFTEWTNVTKALPRYVGHYQPKLPGELGFYDLRQAHTLRRQAELALLGGIYGFCFHNYWFGGERVLDTPLGVLLRDKSIPMRFCLNWANENWTRRWDGSENEIIVAQAHSADDDLAYAESMLPAIDDSRYIRIDGRPLIMLYRPAILPDAAATVDRWRSFFTKLGYGNPYIVMSEAFHGGDPLRYGMDAAAGFPPHNLYQENLVNRLRKLDHAYQGEAFSYDRVMKQAVAGLKQSPTTFPGVMPGWDNEARKPGRGTSFFGSTPAKYGTWLKAAAQHSESTNSIHERLVFINAWNEWAEGAYLEPDRHFGYAYLAETARVLSALSGEEEGRGLRPGTNTNFDANPSSLNRVRNKAISLSRRTLGTRT